MKRHFQTLIVFSLVLISGAFLLYTSQAVQKAKKELKSAQRSVDTQLQAITILEAEWAFLTAPARLEKLVGDVLKVTPESDVQMVKSISGYKQKAQQARMQAASNNSVQE